MIISFGYWGSDKGGIMEPHCGDLVKILSPELCNLQTALQDQKRALDNLCSAFKVLGMSVSGFGMSLGNFHHGIGLVEAKLGGLCAEINILETSANGM